MSQIFVDEYDRRMCHPCSSESIIKKVCTLNEGEYTLCSMCGGRIDRRFSSARPKGLGIRAMREIDFDTWKPKSVHFRQVVSMFAGDQIYIKTRHGVLRIFSVSDTEWESIDVHPITQTIGFETQPILFSRQNKIKHLNDFKFICFNRTKITPNNH